MAPYLVGLISFYFYLTHVQLALFHFSMARIQSASSHFIFFMAPHPIGLILFLHDISFLLDPYPVVEKKMSFTIYTCIIHVLLVCKVVFISITHIPSWFVNCPTPWLINFHVSFRPELTSILIGKLLESLTSLDLHPMILHIHYLKHRWSFTLHHIAYFICHGIDHLLIIQFILILILIDVSVIQST